MEESVKLIICQYNIFQLYLYSIHKSDSKYVWQCPLPQQSEFKK